MSDSGPVMISLRQRRFWPSPWSTFFAVLSALIAAWGILGIVVSSHVDGPNIFFGVVFVAMLVFIWSPLRRIVWWSGTELRIDDIGLFFGSGRPRRRPAQVAYAARNPYLAPWEAVSNLRLVRSHRATRTMWRRLGQRSGFTRQPTAYLGYFPIPGRSALVFDVDLARVTVPEIAPVIGRGLRYGPGIDPERTVVTWAFPVRHPDPVLEALRDRGLVVTETDEPQRPRVQSPYEPRRVDSWALAVEILTRNLGRPPTEAELARLRDGLPERDH